MGKNKNKAAKAQARADQMKDRNDQSNQSSMSASMSPEEANRKKVENLCELYPHVACDEVSDVFAQCGHNIQKAAATLSMLYGDAPDDVQQNGPEVHDQFEQEKYEELPQEVLKEDPPAEQEDSDQQEEGDPLDADEQALIAKAIAESEREAAEEQRRINEQIAAADAALAKQSALKQNQP